MSDITKRFGIITGGTGSFGSMQHTDGSDMGTRVEIFDSSKNLKNITSVSASGDIQGGAGTFGGNVSVAGNLTVNGTTTSVNSTAIDLGDRIINLNSSNASGDAGFYVNDTDTNQTGSLLWDSDQDAWMGGVKDAEVHFVDLSSAQTMTNKTMTSPVISSGDIDSPDIDGGTIDGATIATSDVTVGASKTLDVSAGTLTTSAAQKLAIMQGAGANVDVGAYDLRASTLTADSMTSGRVAIYGANGVLSEDSDLSFSGDKLTVTKLGAYEQAGAVDFSDEAMTNVNIDSGAIDGTNVTVGSGKTLDVSAGTLTLANDQISGDKVEGGTIAATTISALTSTTVSASSFTLGNDSATIDYSSALDLSLGSTKYAALSTTHFSSSVELQGPSMEVSGAAKVGSLTINGTALTATAAEINDLASNPVDGSDFTKLSNITATAAEINYLDNDDLTAADITKLAALTATAAELNYLDNSDLTSADIQKLADITATAAEINDLTSNAVDGSDLTKLSEVTATSTELNYVDVTAAGTAQASKAVVLDGSKNIATIGTVGCGAITSTGASSFGATTLASLNNSSGGITNAGSIAGATSVDGSGDLTMGTITMSGFSVDADGDTSAKSLISTSTISGSGAASAASVTADGLANLGAVQITSTAGAGVLAFAAGTTHAIQNANGDSNIVLDSADGDVTFNGDIRVNGNDIKGSDGVAAITLEGDGTGIIVNDLQSVGTISAAAVSGSGAAELKSLHCDSVDLDGGAIDGTVIGAASAAAGTFTTFTATTSNLGTLGSNVDHANFNSTNVDIDSGAIDGTVIGASSVAAGSFAALAGTTGTFSGVLKSDDTTEATSTTDGSLQTDGGLSVAKSAVVGDDLDLLSDAAILNFGAGKDVNLTHVADTGLLLNSAMKLQFRDSTEFVHSDADGYMHMEGATGVNLAINGSDVLAVSSAKVSSKQDHEFLGSMKFGMGSDHYINNKMGSNNLLLDSAGAGVTAGSWFKVTGDLTVTGNDIKDASNSAAITFDGAGNTDINGTLAASGHITLDNTKDLLAGGADCEIGSNSQKFAAGYFTNVYTGDMHLKNERGDWTIFEESDHLRIRNNATGQTFKMGMTPIEEE
jgi:hypothetical protein